MGPDESLNDAPILFFFEATRAVNQDALRLGEGCGRRQQFLLQRRKLADFSFFDAPSQVSAPTKYAGVRAWRIHQHAVELFPAKTTIQVRSFAGQGRHDGHTQATAVLPNEREP
jgi:hypothetical protein